MSWAKLDDHFDENEKVVGLSDRAFRAYIEGICYAGRNLTDGHLPSAVVSRRWSRAARELERARLWLHDESTGFWIKDFLTYNPSREQVQAKREAERVRKAGHGGADSARNLAQPDLPPSPKPLPSPLPGPDPTPTSGAPPPSANGAGRRDEFFEATMEVLGIPPEGLTGATRTRIGKFATEVRKAGADPRLIRGFSIIWADAHPDIPVTIGVLANHWGEYMAGNLRPLPERRRR